MRKGILFCLTLAISGLAFSQSADRTLVSSGGGTYQAGDYQADVSIGEPVISTLSGGGFVLTQGFQQSMLTITEVEQFLNVEVQMYPNPASDYLNIQFPAGEFNTVTIRVTDLTGKVIMIEELQSELTRLDVLGWNAGTYILSIVADDELVQTCKIIKQ